MKCKKCHVPMNKGTALQNKLVAHPDFPGDSTDPRKAHRGQTMSRTGPPQEVPVWKCPQCGHSVTL